MFAPVALTIIFALSGSLLLSLTLIPVLASFALRAGHHREPWLMRVLLRTYRKVLGFSLAHPVPVFAIAGIGLVLAGAAYLSVGKTFMPTMDEGAVIMQTVKLPSINLSRSVDFDLLVQRTLREKAGDRTDHIARGRRSAWARSDGAQRG